MMCTSNESIRLVHVFRYNLISHSLSLSFLTNLLSLFLATFNFFLLPLPSASLNFWGLRPRQRFNSFFTLRWRPKRVGGGGGTSPSPLPSPVPPLRAIFSQCTHSGKRHGSTLLFPSAALLSIGPPSRENRFPKFFDPEKKKFEALKIFGGQNLRLSWKSSLLVNPLLSSPPSSSSAPSLSHTLSLPLSLTHF